MPSKNPYRTDIARFEVHNGPLFEVYTLAQYKGTFVSVMGGPMTGRYNFGEALDAMAWCLVQSGWENVGTRAYKFKQHEVPAEARDARDLETIE